MHRDKSDSIWKTHCHNSGNTNTQTDIYSQRACPATKCYNTISIRKRPIMSDAPKLKLWGKKLRDRDSELSRGQKIVLLF